MTSLWNPRKPLNQPPGFGRIGRQSDDKPDATARAAERAIHSAQFARDLAAARVGVRRVGVTGE